MSANPTAPTFRAPSGARVREGRVRVRLRGVEGSPAAHARLRYRLLGDVGGGACLVLGGISASHHADGDGGWWSAQVGHGRALDPAVGAVLCVQYLDRLPTGWRAVRSHDQAEAIVQVVRHLDIGVLDAVVGASYGGCVALAMAEQHPASARTFLVISAAHRPAPMATALRAVQRRILALGDTGACPREVVAIARALGMTGYRSDSEFQSRFDAPPRWDGSQWSFPVEDYLMARGRTFASDADPERYRLLSESLDLHRVDPTRLPGHLQVLGVRQDRLVPVGDLRDLALASGADLTLINSHFGHDAFLKEDRRVGRWLRRHLASAGRMRRRA